MTKITATDRSRYLYRRTVKGNAYLYFRMADGALKPLPADQESAEFCAAYDAALAEREGRAKPDMAFDAMRPAGPLDTIERNERVPFLPGTIGRAIARFLGDDEAFLSKAPGTQKRYRRAADEIRQVMGTYPLADLNLQGVDDYLGHLTKKRSATTALIHLIVLGSVWKLCRRESEFNIRNTPNPMRDVHRPKRTVKPWRPWRDHEIERFDTTAPSHLLLARLALHYLAQRGGDTTLLRWDQFDGEGFLMKPEKNYGDDDLEIYLKCPKPLLKAILAEQKKRNDRIARGQTVAPTVLTNAWGKPWASANTLSTALRNHRRSIGIHGVVTHGLRKNAATDVAETLVGGAMGIMAVTNHKTSREAEKYARAAQRRVMNALAVDAWDARIEEKARRRIAEKRAAIRAVK